MPTQITSAGIVFNDATSLTSADIGTAQLVNGSVIASKLGTNEQKGLCKAWVRYDGYVGSQTSTIIPGTYIQSGTTTVTVTTNTPHGLINNQVIYVDIQTGGQSDRTTAVVTVVSPTVYTYVATTSQFTNGSVNTRIYDQQVGTYVGNGTATVTVTTLTPHGLTNGQFIYAYDFTGYLNISNVYAVTVVSPTVYTFAQGTVVVSGDTGFVIAGTPLIYSSYNISSVVYNSQTTVTVNFTNPMNNAYYTINVSGQTVPSFVINSQTTTSFTVNLGSQGAYSDYVSFLVFGS